MRLIIPSILLVCILSACSLVSSPSLTSDQTLFTELGGMSNIENIADLFIEEIGFDSRIFKHFEDTDIDRFRSKLIEHICQISDGPCQYSGDDMIKVHTGMNISEMEFNHTVDLLIAALDKANIKHTTQNKLLARLAPLREEIIYR